MAKIVVTDSDFGDSQFEREMVEAAGIQFAAFNGEEARSPQQIIAHLKGADGATTSHRPYTPPGFPAPVLPEPLPPNQF